jgi:mannosyl-3-phosphoglycerate phosphatase
MKYRRCRPGFRPQGLATRVSLPRAAIQPAMDLVFTDLDGTLLDPETYSSYAARPAIERLNRRGTPWILVTSKTRAEVEFWRGRLEHQHPFIVENGGAAFVPRGYFPEPVPGARELGPYELIEWGAAYEALVADLGTCSHRSRCRVWGFHDMTAYEVAAACDFPLEQAALAKQRQYDEPFLIRDPQLAGGLTFAIEELGRRWTRGGRFWHILGTNDKAAAVLAISALFKKHYGPVRTIGLGDAANDAPFLDAVNVPVLIRCRGAQRFKTLVSRGIVTRRAGPAGWNDAVLSLIGE